MSKTVQTLPKRSDMKIEETWRLEDIFATDAAWEAELLAVKGLVPTIEPYQGKLADSAETLLAALKLKDEISERVGKIYTYAHMRHDQDTTNPTYQSQESRAMTLYTEFGAVCSFMTPEILAIDEHQLAHFLAETPALQLYQHALNRINERRPHVLSADKEALLAQMAEVASGSENAFGMLNDADLTFPTIEDEHGHLIEITHGNYMSLLESTNREVRKQAFKAVYATYDAYKNTFASTLAGVVKKDNFFAKVRNFNSARHAALSRNQIPESVYDQLVETVNDNLHLMHRYMKLRKKVMGLDALHLYDIHTPLIPETKMTVTYEASVALVKESLKVLGPAYSDILEEGFRERWVDVYENEGKRSGAYSSGTYGTAPYILMNWQDTVDELFTLAHEFGHSVHSYFSRKYQPYVYGGYSIFVAEVASTCNEALLNHYMLEKTTDHNERLYLLNNFLDGFRGTVFRQTMFAEYEHLIHQLDQEGEALTAETLTTLYLELNQKYFGEAVVMDEEIGVEWARIPHFYYNYYVYQYATGYAAAQALSKQILEEGDVAAKRYIDAFLKAGSSDYPIDVLKKAGVDMNSAAPIEDAMAVFEHYLTQMEALIDSTDR
ncbi:MAG: oligoendopeptidase F [Defluviitaleaceae bacterium]|nr:oligoendopeptidase F [Defluviitaleaceae bacterium]